MFEQFQCNAEVQEPDFAMYEAKKAAWVKANPGATPTEYEAAMRVIARECGF